MKFFKKFFRKKNKEKVLKNDYLKLKSMNLITYDSRWCVEENKVLLRLEKEGTGG